VLICKSIYACTEHITERRPCDVTIAVNGISGRSSGARGSAQEEYVLLSIIPSLSERASGSSRAGVGARCPSSGTAIEQGPWGAVIRRQPTFAAKMSVSAGAWDVSCSAAAAAAGAPHGEGATTTCAATTSTAAAADDSIIGYGNRITRIHRKSALSSGAPVRKAHATALASVATAADNESVVCQYYRNASRPVSNSHGR